MELGYDLDEEWLKHFQTLKKIIVLLFHDDLNDGKEFLLYTPRTIKGWRGNAL